jgi:CheY-like chemotaxis protein
MSRLARSRILLAEDDPVSLAFLAEALCGLGFEVQGVSDGKAALNAARGQRFDALLLDHHLPGLDGDAVLRALRADADAGSRTGTAIAATAEPDPTIHAHLREAGFARVLLKPLDRAHLRDVLGELGIACTQVPGPHPALDDDAGVRASGSADALAALRGLFARELDALADDWKSLRTDTLALAARLHRVRAACGFCGARALQSAAESLSDALRGAAPERIEASRVVFERALADTRAALERL